MNEQAMRVIDLPALVKRAVTSDELEPMFVESGLTEESILEEIAPKVPDYISSAGDVASTFLKADAELEAANHLREEQTAARGVEPQRIRLYGYRVLISMGVVLLSFALVFAYFLWSDPTVSGKPMERGVIVTMLVIIAGILGLAGFFIWRGWTSGRRWKERHRLYLSTEVLPYDRIADLTRERNALAVELQQTIYDRGVRNEVSGILNRVTIPSYATQLLDYTASGLSETAIAGHEIETQAHRDMDDLMRQPGGSIGLAGARGAGKTTLMAQMARRRGSKGSEPCYVMCPAPVEYSGREYLVTLFLLLCNEVLALRSPETASLPSIRPESGNDRPSIMHQDFLHLVSTATLYLIILGQVLFLSGLGFAYISMRATQQAAATAHPAAQAPKGAANTPEAQASTQKSASMRYLELVGLGPHALIVWGWWMAAIAFLTRWALQRFYQLRRERIDQERSSASAELPQMNDDALCYAARVYRDTLRFQQSYTSGWSGGLKLPFGVEGSANDAQTMSRNQRSLPELVSDFREFLVRVTLEYERVCICIDELDKLESDEKAHLFLNEIKAVFGVRKVFYLVSVSENAISAFERRGLPFRDVFDSSFDAIVHVDYLKLDESKDLLKRRTTKIPEPFLCLCHCLSGGLPRDLIRACREMLDVAKDERETELIALARRVILREARGKARGMSIAVSKLTADADQTKFLSALTELLSRVLDETALLAQAAALLISAEELQGRAGNLADRGDTTAREQVLQLSTLAALQIEFGLYLAYAATVVEVMIDLQPRWAQADAELTAAPALQKAIPMIDLYCNKLASTRQALAVSAPVGRERLAKLRSELGMSIEGIVLPQAPVFKRAGLVRKSRARMR